MNRPANEQLKATLRFQLQKNAQRFGLTPQAIESLVAQGMVRKADRGERVVEASDASDLITFLVAGVVRVECETAAGEPMTLLFAKAGQFIATGWLFEQRPPQRAFGATAHSPALVAMWSQQSIMEVMARLEPPRALQLMAYGWRAFSSLLRQKFLMLPMSVRDRVLFQMNVLAKDFGRRSDTPPGVLIDLELTQGELASLVVADRARVNKALMTLRRQALLTTVDKRFVLSESGMTAAPRP